MTNIFRIGKVIQTHLSPILILCCGGKLHKGRYHNLEMNYAIPVFMQVTRQKRPSIVRMKYVSTEKEQCIVQTVGNNIPFIYIYARLCKNVPLASVEVRAKSLEKKFTT